MTTPINNPGPVVINPDGTTNYGASVPSGGTSTPVDASGALDVWNIPAWMQGKVIWYDTGFSQAHSSSKGPPQVKNREVAFEDKYGNGPAAGPKVSVDQNMTAEQVMKQFAAMSQRDPYGFAAVQKELQAGGWYGSAASVYGGFNGQTESAIANALSQYIKVSQGSNTPVSFVDFLKNSAAANEGINGNVPGGAGAGSSAPVLTDPDTLTRYAQEAAQTALGRSLSKSEISSFISEFHNQQVQSYTDAAGHNGLSAMKDDPRASAVDFVTNNNSEEFGQHQIQGYTDAFLNMFLPSGSAAPTPTMDPQGIGY